MAMGLKPLELTGLAGPKGTRILDDQETRIGCLTKKPQGRGGFDANRSMRRQPSSEPSLQ